MFTVLPNFRVTKLLRAIRRIGSNYWRGNFVESHAVVRERQVLELCSRTLRIGSAVCIEEIEPVVFYNRRSGKTAASREVTAFFSEAAIRNQYERLIFPVQSIQTCGVAPAHTAWQGTEGIALMK